MQTQGSDFNHQSGHNFPGEYKRLFLSHFLWVYNAELFLWVNSLDGRLVWISNPFTNLFYPSLIFKIFCVMWPVVGYCTTFRQFCVFDLTGKLWLWLSIIVDTSSEADIDFSLKVCFVALWWLMWKDLMLFYNYVIMALQKQTYQFAVQNLEC